MYGFYKKWIDENEGHTDKVGEDSSDEQRGLELLKDTKKAIVLENNLEGTDPIPSKKWSLWGLIASTRKVFTVTSDQHTNQPGTSDQYSNQPGTSDQHSNQPKTSDQYTNQPGTSDQHTNQPVTSDQHSNQLGTSDQHTKQQVTSDQHTNQPVTSDRHSNADKKIQNSKGKGDKVKEMTKTPSEDVRGLESTDLDNNLEGKHRDYQKMSLQGLIENSKRILFGKGAMKVDQSLLMEEEQLQQLISVLLLSSDSCPDNMLDVEPHPIDQTLVMFAQLVYTEKNPGEEDAAYSTRILSGKLHGWKILITATNKDWFNGYFGAVFVHTGFQQVVVAHRGTNPCCPGAVYTDLKGIFGTNYTSCMNSATTFVDQIRQAIISVNDHHKRHYTLAITGHSLGAWLAQITTFSIKYLAIKQVGSQISLEKNPEVGIHAKTVGFDSPGARDMLDRVLDDHYDRYEGNVLLDGLDITVYLSAPNHINTCGMHLGKIYRISNDVSNLICEDGGTFKYTLVTHAISNFIDAFKDDNCTIGEVSDWAKSHKEFKELFKILNWENNYHGHAKIDNSDDLKKIHRYKVAELNSPENVNSFRVFSKGELQMLNRMQILQEQTSKLTILDKFININKLEVKSTKLLPKFGLDHYNRTIKCASGESLAELCKRLKQLMRWLKPQFTQAVEEQIKVLNQPADFIYYAEGQSYLDSLPNCCLDFTDSVGFQDFLVSSTEQVLCLSANSGDGAFQISRLWNILHQMEGSNEASESSIKYISKNHFTFVRQSQLQNLINNYGWPVEKDYLIVVDCTLSPITFIVQLLKDVYNNNIKYSKSLKLVLIVLQSIDVPDFFNFCKTVIFASDIRFSDLTPDSQSKLLSRDDVIITTDKAYSFREFLGDHYSVREINQILSSECLKNFASINNFAFNIEDTRPTLSDIQMPFFKLNIKTSMEFFTRCVKSPNTNILVVMSGLGREDLETGADWEQLNGMDIILAEGDAQLSFRDTCKKNHEKCIYLFEVLGRDVYCREIFNGCFYLHRKFLHRAYIDMKKFTETEHADDLFVVNNEKNKKSLLELIENCTKREAFRNNVIITDAAKPVVIKQYMNKQIHFVKINQCEESYKLEWRYSHGSLESLFPCMSKDSCEPIEEITLSKTERNLVIITDEPGMGKTTSLARLSRLMESPWVIYMELKYFQVHIDRLPEVLTTKSVARFLLSECRSQAEVLLEYLLESKMNSKQVVLMFDGFDEIDDYIQKKESSKDKLIKLFVFLQSKPAVQIFITARNYLTKSLEEQLRQTSTCFVRISTQEQQDYLFVFWRSCLSLELGDYGEEEEGRLKEYAGEVLQQAKEVLGPDMDCFMGVPLQLRMLAEVFRPQSGLLQQPLKVLLKQINIINLSSLYKKFIDLKYEIYLHEKTSKNEKLDKEEFNSYLEHVTKTHGKLAFRLFFPDFYDENFDAIEDKWLNKLNRHGLVQSERNEGFQFVHRTYAEYCCAEIVIHWLNQPKSFSRHDLFKEILVPQILLHPDSKIIRMFMNAQLKEKQLSKKALELIAKCISKLWLKDSAIFRNQEHQTILHIAVVEKNEQIVRFLLSGLNIESAQEASVSLITQYDLDNNTALNMLDKPKLHSINGDNLVLDGPTTSILQCIKTCSDETKGKILFASLFNRDESNSGGHRKMTLETKEVFIFRRLFNRNNIFAPPVNKEELVVVNLFGRIIRKYINRTSRIIDRIKEVELLVINQFSWAIQHNIVTVKRILSKDLKTNIELYCLLMMKHKIHDSQTCLHIAARKGDLRMVKLLAEQCVVPFNVLVAQRHRKMTPLHTASVQGHLDVVKYLVERGAAINTRCGGGISDLMYATKSGNLQTVKYLIERGADIHASDNVGWTALYYAAVEGCVPVVEYLLCQGADLDKLDLGGGTLLTRALQKRELDVVWVLLEWGVDVNADEGEALSYAILWGKWFVVKALVEKGAAVKESLVWKSNLFDDSKNSANERMNEFRKKFPSFKFAKEN